MIMKKGVPDIFNGGWNDEKEATVIFIITKKKKSEEKAAQVYLGKEDI